VIVTFTLSANIPVSVCLVDLFGWVVCIKTERTRGIGTYTDTSQNTTNQNITLPERFSKLLAKDGRFARSGRGKVGGVFNPLESPLFIGLMHFVSMLSDHNYFHLKMTELGPIAVAFTSVSCHC